MPLHKNGTFAPGRDATRTAAARVLASLNQQQHGVAVSDDPYQAGGRRRLDRRRTRPRVDPHAAAVRPRHRACDGAEEGFHQAPSITAADGWKPEVPTALRSEQVARAIGARYNVPFGADNWETWPGTTLRRANLAVQAYQLAHLPSYWQYSATAAERHPRQAAAVPAAEARGAGAARSRTPPHPTSGAASRPQPQNLFGLPAAGGFDCSGFVWWVLKLHTYTASDGTWSGNAQIPWRTTYDMAVARPGGEADHLRQPASRRHPVLEQRAEGRATRSARPSTTPVSTSGNGWTINSHGDGAGRHDQLHGAGRRLVPRRVRLRLAGHARRQVGRDAADSLHRGGSERVSQAHQSPRRSPPDPRPPPARRSACGRSAARG